jgi:hypothetical protein
MRSLPLLCHALTPCPFVRSLQVYVHDRDDRTLSLRYVLEGDVEQLRIPPPQSPARVDELWRHTCFEVFVKPADSPSYLELNFAPSGEWAAYQFTAYRGGMTNAAEVSAPTITSARTSSHLELTASVNIPFSAADRLRLAISAVIEDSHEQRSYWAVAHPPGRPDFHHDDGFVLSY